MPLYDYRCAQCGQTIEIRHGFNESYGEPCAHCGGVVSRVFTPAPILFTGSGFYVTDSRPASSSGEASSSPPSGESAA